MVVSPNFAAPAADQEVEIRTVTGLLNVLNVQALVTAVGRRSPWWKLSTATNWFFGRHVELQAPAGHIEFYEPPQRSYLAAGLDGLRQLMYLQRNAHRECALRS